MQTILIATDKPFAKVAVDGIREIVKKAGFRIETPGEIYHQRATS